MSQEWDIKPRAIVCGACARAFEDRQHYHSCLTFDEQGYTRGDYCDPCWMARAAQASGVSSWKGVFRVPPPAPEPPLRKETAESLLRKLIEDSRPDQAGAMFVLAVMLERNRVLVERDVQKRDDGTLNRVYEHRKTGESFLIHEPRLRLDQLEDVQREVVLLLGGTPPEEKAPAAGPPAPAAGAAARVFRRNR